MREGLRLGVIGCGDIAGYMAWFARLNRRIELVACCDTSPERAARFARRHRIPHHTTSYRQMLDGRELDTVYLAVPHHLHYEMLGAAVSQGLPVLVEKPITRTLAEGEEIVRLAREKQVRIGVNYQYRYDAGCYPLARAVQGGALGQVHYARCHVPWHRELDYFRDAPWHGTWAEAGGGTLITQGSHVLDLLLWAIGGRPITAVGYTAQRKFRQVEVEDLAQATVEMEGGALLQICSSMIADPEGAVTLEIYGDRGTAVYANRPRPHVRFRGIRVKKAGPPVRGVHALQRSLEGFRAWVMEDKPYLIPAETALPALAVVEAIYRSAESGRREAISPIRYPTQT
jgi:UDP-N-acetyl-2-amino-2-deoxyglucuronate dehydrogenase